MSNTFEKRYKIRRVGDGGAEISVPKIVIERAAKRVGETFDQFIETHDVVHLFNGFEGVDAAYRFERKEVKNEVVTLSISSSESNENTSK